MEILVYGSSSVNDRITIDRLNKNNKRLVTRSRYELLCREAWIYGLFI